MTCVQCNKGFPANNELASLPWGDRIAFDVGMGRVWQVCGACWHWNLVGTEVAALSLPELSVRFNAGEIRQFETIGISRVAHALDLIAVQPPADLLQPSIQPLVGAARDDIAAGVRQREINRRIRIQWATSGFLGLYFAFVIGHRSLTLMNGGVSIVTPVLVALSAWYLLLYVSRRNTGAKFFSPASVFRTRAGGDRFSHHASSIQILLSVLMLTVWTVPDATAIALLATILLIALWTIGLAGLFLPSVGEVSGDTPKLRSRARALLLLTSSIAAAWWSELVPHDAVFPLVVTSAILIALGAWLIHALDRKRRKLLSYHDPSGVLHQSAPLLLRMGWSNETQELEVVGLPHVPVLKGAEARDVIRKSLYHGAPPQPVSMEQTTNAAELVRSLGGLRGVVTAILSIRPEADSRIYPSQIPEPYRLALDLALAGNDKTPSGIYALELAAESASQIAEEAERLDATIAAPPKQN